MNLQAKDLFLTFKQPDGTEQTVVDIEQFAADATERVAVTGPSGAGKTSLLYALTGIRPPDSGTVRWSDTELTSLREAQRDRWRRENVGFIFQDFHLFPGLSVLGNVLLPTTFGRTTLNGRAPERARELLERVGAPHAARSVETLSRGERQRIGIARALLLSPKVIVADEPTANLDHRNAQSVTDLLISIAESTRAMLLVISHDREVLDRMTTVYHLEKGAIVDKES